MSLQEMMQRKDKSFRKNMDQFVVNTALRSHVEGVFEPQHKRVLALQEEVKKLTAATNRDREQLVATMSAVTTLKELTFKVAD